MADNYSHLARNMPYILNALDRIVTSQDYALEQYPEAVAIIQQAGKQLAALLTQQTAAMGDRLDGMYQIINRDAFLALVRYAEQTAEPHMGSISFADWQLANVTGWKFRLFFESSEAQAKLDHQHLLSVVQRACARRYIIQIEHDERAYGADMINYYLIER